MKWFQLAIIVIQFFGFCMGVKSACEGSEGKSPTGFQGVMIALFAQLVVLTLLWGAGATSEWIP